MSVNLPDYVCVPSAALVRLLDAIKGPHHMIWELLATKDLSASLVINGQKTVDNPIRALEEVLSAYELGEKSPALSGVQNFDITVNVDKEMITEAFEEVLKNYARIGGDTEGDKLLSHMIAESLVVARWTDCNGKVYYGVDRYNHTTKVLEPITVTEHETAREALAAYFAKQSLGAVHV